MVKIEHMAVWVADLERMKNFYVHYFHGKANQKYVNAARGFSSYFITFSEGPRLEIMNLKNTIARNESMKMKTGWAHLAFSLGSQKEVLRMTEMLRRDGYTIQGEPRTTGDGYFESVILDPEGNQIELTE